jgi:membrane-associated protease RseP (regulator of RpoE activity)
MVLETVWDLLLEYKYIIFFYLLIISFLVINRKRITTQGKIIFLYRTKLGLRWMDFLSAKFKEWIILGGYIGVGISFIGLAFISIFLIYTLITYFTAEQVISGASLVYPGMTIPGIGVLPFWDWLLAIFIIAVVHEFSHGIVARAHNIKVLNTGLAFFGPILGAFVEPDEKQMQKKSDITQYSVLAAGSVSNIILALLAFLLLNFAIPPLYDALSNPDGFTFDSYLDGSYPFAQAQVSPGTLIIGIDGQRTADYKEFAGKISSYRPGDQTKILTKDPKTEEEKEYLITLASSPDDPNRGFLGIQSIHDERKVKDTFASGFSHSMYSFLGWFAGFLLWLFILSLGIGIFNLLPLPIVDGGRMVQVFLRKLKGKEQGDYYYLKIGLFFLIVLALTIVYPWIIKLL